MSRNGGAADGGQCEVCVMIEPDPEAGPEDAERMTRQLRDELRELDLDVVIPRSSEESPPHAKGGGIDWGTLLVTLSATGGVFTVMIATIQQWLDQRRLARGITMTIDGDTITLNRASEQQRDELVRMWVRRHSEE
jgi:Effector Associated Constant Component 1